MFIKIASKTSAHASSNLFLNFISSLQHSQLHKHTVDDCLYTTLQGRDFEMDETELILIALFVISHRMCASLCTFRPARVWMCISVISVQTHEPRRLLTQVWRSFDWGCQRWLPTQQLELLGECVSVDVCNVIVVSLKEFLIEMQRQMAHIHYAMIG